MYKKILFSVVVLALCLQLGSAQPVGELWNKVTQTVQSMVPGCKITAAVPKLDFSVYTSEDLRDHTVTYETYICNDKALYNKPFYTLHTIFTPTSKDAKSKSEKLRYYQKDTLNEIFVGPKTKEEVLETVP